jgi:hypothetical protein
VEEEVRKHYGQGMKQVQLVLPREIPYALSDTLDISQFRKTLLMNKCRHHTYNPSYDIVFNRLLYKGLHEEVENIEDTAKKTG